jgi:hypothetical protein
MGVRASGFSRKSWCLGLEMLAGRTISSCEDRGLGGPFAQGIAVPLRNAGFPRKILSIEVGAVAELERKVRQVRGRLLLFRFCDSLVAALLVAALLCVLVLIVSRLTTAFAPQWLLLTMAGLFVAAIAVAGMTTIARRTSMLEAAVVIDDRLGLRERLSSALLLKGHEDPNGAIQALERDAQRYAANVRPGQDFRYKAPRTLPHLFWPVMAGVLVYMFMPQMDLFATTPGDDEKEESRFEGDEKLRQQESQELRELAKETEAKAEELEDEALGQFARDLERLADDLEMGLKDRKATIAELSRMEDEVRMQRRDMARSMEPFRQISGLSRSQQTRELRQSLKDQDFSAAAQMLQDMAMEALQQKSPEELEQLAQELQQLAQELKDNPAMQNALEQAAQAMENLAQAQQQQQQQSQQQQSGGQQGEQSQSQGSQQQSGQQQGQNQSDPGQQQNSSPGQPQSSNQGDQSMPPGSQDAMAQAQQALQQAAQQMQNQQQMMQQMQQLAQLQQQMSECQGGMMGQSGQQQSGQQSQNPGTQSQSGQQGQQGGQQGQQQGNQQGQGQGQGEGQQGQGQQPGQGQGQGQGQGEGGWQQNWSAAQSMSGGGGQGGGPRPNSGLVNVDFVDEMIRGEKNEGEILAVIEIDAPAARGESSVQYQEVYTRQAQRAADAMRTNEIPMGYRNAVREYFEAINPESGRRPD